MRESGRRSSGMDVICLKASTMYAPGSVIAVMADATLKGRNRAMGASVISNGEYGLSNVPIGLSMVWAGIELRG